MANLKFVGNGEDKGKIHEIKDTDLTVCSKKYSDNPEDWESTSESVTCMNCLFRKTLQGK